MGCPYMTGHKAPSGSGSNEYPFEELYRPWSWFLGYFGNVLAFLILWGIFIRLWRSRRKALAINYRRLVVKVIGDEVDETKAVVIGGLGFVGRSLVKQLVRNGGYRVSVLDCILPDEDCLEDGVCSYIRCDLTSTDDVEMALRETKPDVVFHTASMDPTVDITYLRTVSEKGSESILLACQRAEVKRLIYTSSVAAVIGDRYRNYEDMDESVAYPDKPCSAYSGGMAAGEELLLANNGQDGLMICVLRAGMVYGASSLLFKMVQNYSRSNSNMDVVSVDYFAQAHILADQKFSKDIAGKVYFISGESLTCSEFCSFAPDLSVSGLRMWSKWLLSCMNSFIRGRSNVLLTDVLLQLPSYTIDGSLAVKELGLEKPPPCKQSVEEYLAQCHKSGL